MDTPTQAPAAAPAPAPAAPQPADLRGVPDAVQRIQAILQSENSTPEQVSAGRTPDGRFVSQKAQQEQPSAQPAQPSEEAPVGPNTQVEGDNTQPVDAPATLEIPLDQLEAAELEVVIKGEDGKDITEKRKIKELREGYMRQADYSRKTAEIARQREQVREETRKASEAATATLVTELKTMHDLVLQTAASELGNVDWNDLAQNNAFEYVRLDNRRKQITQTLESIRAKHAEATSKVQEQQKQARNEQATKALATLEAEIPGWNDALYQSLMKAGIEKYGYKQDEVAAWIDPRAFKLLHKASLYDQMQSEKTAPAPDKRVVVAPKVVKPGVTREVNQAAQRDAAALTQLQKSGRIEDAAAVIRSRLR